jgi:hypothetical protein
VLPHRLRAKIGTTFDQAFDEAKAASSCREDQVSKHQQEETQGSKRRGQQTGES